MTTHTEPTTCAACGLNGNDCSRSGYGSAECAPTPTHTEPTSEAVEVAYHRLLHPVWRTSTMAADADFRRDLATIRTALTAAEERARKAEAGRCDTCFYQREYAGDEWCEGDSKSDRKMLHADCWRARDTVEGEQ